jgi:hypothetical protein
VIVLRDSGYKLRIHSVVTQVLILLMQNAIASEQSGPEFSVSMQQDRLLESAVLQLIVDASAL